MSNENRRRIQPTENGPYIVEGAGSLRSFSDGKVHELGDRAALCRCGASGNKPFCDGSHKRVGFSSAKEPDRMADRRDNYEGKGITIHDNRGVCAHAAKCTEGLGTVFRLGTEPWVDPEGAPVDEIILTIRGCPSGALSYSTEGEEHRDHGGDPGIAFVPNGPYVVTGGAALVGVELGEGATTDHLTLCRCGASKNKPFCNGAHWNVKFDENAASATGSREG